MIEVTFGKVIAEGKVHRPSAILSLSEKEEKYWVGMGHAKYVEKGTEGDSEKLENQEDQKDVKPQKSGRR